MERVAKGDRTYCAAKTCKIRKECKHAMENYDKQLQIYSSSFPPEPCTWFEEIKDF